MINHQIPMRKDEKTYDKPSDSYEKKVRKLIRYNQIPMRKDEKTYKIPSMRKRMINHQIPMRKDEKTYDKPSDFYGKRLENQ